MEIRELRNELSHISGEIIFKTIHITSEDAMKSFRVEQDELVNKKDKPLEDQQEINNQILVNEFVQFEWDG